MPDFCHPNLIVSDLMLSKADTSHPACKGFKVDSFKSVWIASKYFPLSSSDWTCRTYQFENSFFMCFLNSSFPDKSSGCNSEVHPAGTYRIRMLFFVISSLKSDTWWALKTSKIHKAGDMFTDMLYVWHNGIVYIVAHAFAIWSVILTCWKRSVKCEREKGDNCLYYPHWLLSFIFKKFTGYITELSFVIYQSYRSL